MSQVPADFEAVQDQTPDDLKLPTDTVYKAVGFIETYTGRPFWPLQPSAEGLSIIDIAHALSNQCRYSGHVAWFYPTAQHCCLLADYCLANGFSALVALQLLMHDGAEAYLVDVPRPVKQFMPQYRLWDHAINVCIREWMDWSHLPIPSVQDEFDSRIIVDERAQLMCRSGNDWGHRLEPLGVTIERWTPERAEKEFLTRYAALTREVYGFHNYMNYDWGIPVKTTLAASSDHYAVADVAEVDVRGGVARIKLRGDDGILQRDPTRGMPVSDFAWHHGRFTVMEAKNGV
jgi:hypothetical protein